MIQKQKLNSEAIVDDRNVVREDFKLVKMGTDMVIYEGGYWMDREDFDRANFGKIRISRNIEVPLKDYITFDVDKKTRKITYTFLPNSNL